jgi:hypothetical protein
MEFFSSLWEEKAITGNQRLILKASWMTSKPKQLNKAGFHERNRLFI